MIFFITGSAGATLAARLAEIPTWKILLLEAGGDPPDELLLPVNYFNPIPPQIQWGYGTSPKEDFAKGFAKNSSSFKRVKVLGGCSSVNAMYYVRGGKQDYDDWQNLGNPEWSYEHVLPFFKKSEKFTALKLGEIQTQNQAVERFHGTTGPITINKFMNDPQSDPIRNALVESGKRIGFNYNPDVNGPSAIGFTDAEGTIDENQVRMSTARAFLTNIPENLKICKFSLVQKLIFQGKKAIGVEFLYKNQQRRVKASKEIILSGGTFGSPAILERSGIGRRDILERIDVNILHELPGVGENMHNQLLVSGNMFTSKPVALPARNKASVRLQRFGAFLNTQNRSQIPDIQLYFNTLNKKDLVGISGFKKDISDQLQSALRKRGGIIVFFAPLVLFPDYRGFTHVKDMDPNSEPDIFANVLATKTEINAFLRGFRLIEEMIKTQPLSEFQLQLVPFRECLQRHRFKSDGYYVCTLRTVTDVGAHPVGTCGMGPKSNKLAVVDHKLRVYGIERLRVADASIMPTINRGTTNAPSIMIGERAADFIKKHYKKN